MPSMLNDFKDFVKDTNGLIIWALGAGVLGAVSAKFAGVSPPWPSAGTSITCAAMLLALMRIFLRYRGLSRAVAIKNFRASNYMLVLCAVLYLAGFSLFVETNTQGQMLVTGFICTEEAKLVFSSCPFLSYDELAQASFLPEKLWTKLSISIVKVSLFCFWVVSFSLFINSVGTFVLYTRAQRLRTKR